MKGVLEVRLKVGLSKSLGRGGVLFGDQTPSRNEDLHAQKERKEKISLGGLVRQNLTALREEGRERQKTTSQSGNREQKLSRKQRRTNNMIVQKRTIRRGNGEGKANETGRQER